MTLAAALLSAASLICLFSAFGWARTSNLEPASFAATDHVQRKVVIKPWAKLPPEVNKAIEANNGPEMSRAAGKALDVAEDIAKKKAMK